jgi:hypothetical protein
MQVSYFDVDSTCLTITYFPNAIFSPISDAEADIAVTSLAPQKPSSSIIVYYIMSPLSQRTCPIDDVCTLSVYVGMKIHDSRFKIQSRQIDKKDDDSIYF